MCLTKVTRISKTKKSRVVYKAAKRIYVDGLISGYTSVCKHGQTYQLGDTVKDINRNPIPLSVDDKRQYSCGFHFCNSIKDVHALMELLNYPCCSYVIIRCIIPAGNKIIAGRQEEYTDNKLQTLQSVKCVVSTRFIPEKVVYNG